MVTHTPVRAEPRRLLPPFQIASKAESERLERSSLAANPVQTGILTFRIDSMAEGQGLAP